MRIPVLVPAAILLSVWVAPSAALDLRKGDHVCVIGNTFGERMQSSGYFETLLHVRHADEEIVFRNLAWSADTLTLKPRPLDCPSQDEFLTTYKAGVILACFGLNESFESTATQFQKDLEAFVDHTMAQKYDGRNVPRLVLISPVAHEPMASPGLPDAAARNVVLRRFVGTMEVVAKAKKVEFVDLFRPLAAAYQQNPGRRLTINGIHLNDEGERFVAALMDEALFGPPGDLKDKWPAEKREPLRTAVNDKSAVFWQRYRPVNPFYIYGGRAAPFGTISFPPEMERLDGMLANRDRRVWDLAQGKPVPPTVDDASLKAVPATETSLKEAPPVLTPEEERQSFTMLDGFEVNLFASEVEFPDLKKPVQMTFDARGRLWVTTIPTYPHLSPGQQPQDKVLILTDSDGDGKADRCQAFAENLYLPIGIELGYGGAYVSAQPNLLFLPDTNGDDKADESRTVLHGFGTEDSHHSISAFVWGPGGGLHMMEGTFHHSQIETPRGPVRLENAGVFRYEPNTERLGVYVTYNYANPWGITFDKWGRNYIADASGGDNHYANAYSGWLPYPEKHANIERFTAKEAHVRPTSGCEVVSSRHFPDGYQQWWLLNNTIGFQGTRMFRVIDEGSGFKSTEWKDLIVSTHPSFRPVDLEFGPDGALYIVDWYSPIIGHMQYSLRDPKRDKAHGRIWRITAKGRDLVKPAAIHGAKTADLLELLRIHEDRTRYRVRRELAARDTPAVLAAIERFLAGLSPNDAEREHLQLECLWVQQHHGAVQQELLERVLASKEARARAAGVYVLRWWHDRIRDSAKLLKAAASDEYPIVRLEAVVAASFVHSLTGVDIALEVLKKPVDHYIDYALKETMRALDPQWKEAVAKGQPFAADNPAGLTWLMQRFSNEEVLALPKSPAVWNEVLRREGMNPVQLQKAVEALAADGKSAVHVILEALPQARGTTLAWVLANWNPEELRAAAPDLTKLVKETKSVDVRTAAMAALVTHEKGETAWQLAVQNADFARALLNGLPMVKSDGLLDPFAPRLVRLLKKLPDTLAKSGPAAGRFVRVELPRKGTLSLTEVEVYAGGQNIALAGAASQSSTAFGGAASRAIDGGTHGEWGRGTTTHTAQDENNPWWELDLRASQPVEKIVITNRYDGDFGNRLEGFTLTILNGARQVVFQKTGVAAAKRIELPISADGAGVLRAAAVRAYASLYGRAPEKYAVLLPLFNDAACRPAVIAALKELDPAGTPAAALEKAAAALKDLLTAAPLEQRTTPWFYDSVALARNLASRVPALKSKLSALIDREAPGAITIKATALNLFYDKKEFTVKAGGVVAITFDNGGDVPHNLIIGAPGSLEKIGAGADAIVTQAGAQERSWIPDVPEVLHRMRMLQPHEKDVLIFRAPEKPGDYVYVCTFPGHWRLMQGVMHVE